MKRSISIHSGWPSDEQLSSDCDATVQHLGKEGWVVFLHEGRTKNAGMLTHSWESVMDYARRWMMGESVEEIERATR